MEALDPDVFLADVETVEEQEEEELEWLSNKDAFPAVEICMLQEEEPNSISVTREKKKKDAKRPKLNKRGRKCTHCGMTQTQIWRKGPLGDRTLCNPFGIRYRSGRLYPEYRPANSPTFSSELHSYRHSEVLHRRQSKYGAAAEPSHKCTIILAKSKKDPSPAIETSNTSEQPSGVIIAEQQSPVSVLKHSKNSSTTLMSSCETLTIPHRPRSKGLHKRSAIPWQQVGIGRSRMTITTELMLVTLDNGDGTFITKTLCNACHQWFKYGCRISDGLDIGRKCLHCGIGETSLWQPGPLGSKTLCNACGLQWYLYGEVRPDYRPRNQCSQTQRSCQHCGKCRGTFLEARSPLDPRPDYRPHRRKQRS